LAVPGEVDPNFGFPDWTKNGLLQAFLLHEVGHTFGVGHIQETIMDSALSYKLMWNKISDPLKSTIDGKRDLQFCWNCPLNYSGVLGFGTGIDEDIKVFQRLTGRKPKGTIISRLEGVTLWTVSNLKISDDIGSFALPINVAPQSQGPLFSSGISIFKRVTEAVSTEQSNYGQVLFGALTDAQGNKLNVVLEINSSNDDLIGPITIKEIKDGTPHTIYRAEPKQ
jgi:hypothetical protein